MMYFCVQISVCGEHAGDPMSINFFDRIGADNVTCSPYRIPIAKVAAAQAHIEETASKLKHNLLGRDAMYLYAAMCQLDTLGALSVMCACALCLLIPCLYIKMRV